MQTAVSAAQLENTRNTNEHSRFLLQNVGNTHCRQGFSGVLEGGSPQTSTRKNGRGSAFPANSPLVCGYLIHGIIPQKHAYSTYLYECVAEEIV